MRRPIALRAVFAAAFALALGSFATEASAQEEEEEEVTTLRKSKVHGDEKVQVIIVNQDDDDDRPRRRRKPRTLEAIDGEKPPPGYHVESKGLKGVWVGGISMFASSYFLTILGGAIADIAEDHEEGQYTYWALLPAAGPFVIAAHEEIGPPAKVTFAIFGLIQTGGLGMFIGGLAAKKDIWVRDASSLEPQVQVGLGSIGLLQRF